MFPERYFPTRFYAPRYWPKVGADAEAPSNTNPTRRFSVSRHGTRFTVDGSGRAFTGSDGKTLFSTDSNGNTFTDSSGSRFTGDGE